MRIRQLTRRSSTLSINRWRRTRRHTTWRWTTSSRRSHQTAFRLPKPPGSTAKRSRIWRSRSMT